MWEAAQGTPLPAYVARYTHQLKVQLSPPSTGEAGGGGSGKRRAGADGSHEDATAATAGEETHEQAHGDIAAAPSAAPPIATSLSKGKGASPTSHRRSSSGGNEGVASAAAGAVEASAPAEAVAPAPAAAVPAKPLRAPRVLVVCNKCDSMPCPMPQIRGLPQAQAFIAVSAERGTNLAHLWSMVLPVLSSSSDRKRGGAEPGSPTPTSSD